MVKSKEERRAKRQIFKAKLKNFTRHACKVTACTMTGAKIGALILDPVVCTLLGFSYGVISVLKDDVTGDVGPTVLDVVLPSGQN
ncbi:hypothetical protein SETIT_1G036500v2 [Setaria italica]|uniref:Uncharacterized protein n=1 Tax=Setaria italica TaxID=4555 RepID=K4APK7_SETIT|nr:hypothetical protein SETIT_J030400v2 [Setaria italica]RCV04875.1 hypothetical protein SETIT_1G036400v2 [Setaria italica]RCV04876.1 hypothetical protein SETIT_1G036500v2 [Setaria italica]